jgi:hypothetical protein
MIDAAASVAGRALGRRFRGSASLGVPSSWAEI